MCIDICKYTLHRHVRYTMSFPATEAAVQNVHLITKMHHGGWWVVCGGEGEGGLSFFFVARLFDRCWDGMRQAVAWYMKSALAGNVLAQVGQVVLVK